MLIRHPTSGLFWSVNDNGEVCLANEGSVYVKSTCDVPPHLFHFDDNTSHLKNTVTGKCICRLDGKLVEAEHTGININQFEWTIVDGLVQSYMNKYVEADLTLVDDTATQWHIAESFEEEVPVEVEQAITETVAEVLAPTPVEEVSAPVEEEEDVPVNRAAALIEEALNAQAAEEAPAPIEEAPAPVEQAPTTEEVEA